jgi:hypothetical protein
VILLRETNAATVAAGGLPATTLELASGGWEDAPRREDDREFGALAVWLDVNAGGGGSNADLVLRLVVTSEPGSSSWFAWCSRLNNVPWTQPDEQAGHQVRFAVVPLPPGSTWTLELANESLKTLTVSATVAMTETPYPSYR